MGFPKREPNALPRLPAPLGAGKAFAKLRLTRLANGEHQVLFTLAADLRHGPVTFPKLTDDGSAA